MKKLFYLIIFLSSVAVSSAQTTNITLGAYYFNGWTSTTDSHITPDLAANYPERTPKWGWVTGTPDVMKEQIDLAADAGLSFFAFCWYYPTANKANFKHDPLNQALNYYLEAPNNNRLKFCVLLTNHNGFIVGPEDWSTVTAEFLKLFKNKQYLTVNNKPLLIIYSLQTLVDKFGSDEAVKQAIESLKSQARAEGLNGVTVAANVPAVPGNIGQARNCGIDIFTGYNYHTVGYKQGDTTANSVIPISKLTSESPKTWDFYTKYGTPVIPVGTLNWDPRPWVSMSKFYSKSPRYTGYSAQSVYNTISALRQWMYFHPNNVTSEHIALLYAWNEYGEGAWLTPSVQLGNQLLGGVKAALK